jgi:uncharacterized protein YxeA
MKTILLAVVAAVLIGAGAAALLSTTQKTAYVAYTTSGARVSEPGHNLVGPAWTGNL